jgi:superfamily II DNA/RNA helicase
MLDMGFLPDIRRVLKHLPARRQTLFFSATMPPPIAQLSREMLRDPVLINTERQAEPATGVTQAAYPVPENLKSALLLELLRTGAVGNAIVFCRTKHRANRLAEYLDRQGVANARIHGNRSQTARTDALAGFRSGRYRVLVATGLRKTFLQRAKLCVEEEHIRCRKSGNDRTECNAEPETYRIDNGRCVRYAGNIHQRSQQRNAECQE